MQFICLMVNIYVEIKDKEKKSSWSSYVFYLYYLLCFIAYINTFWGAHSINLDLIKVFTTGLHPSMSALHIYTRVA